MKLYSYWRSSCSFRARIALSLKELLKLNPIGYVPVLVDGDTVLADSLAIILYLDEKYPEHLLLPSDLKRKATNLQAAIVVSSSIQPLQNLYVLLFHLDEYIKQKVGQEDIVPSVKYHVGKGFAALEELLKGYAGRYAIEDELFLGSKTKFPLLTRLHEAYSQLPAFQDATLEKQPDAPSSSTSLRNGFENI